MTVTAELARTWKAQRSAAPMFENRLGILADAGRYMTSTEREQFWANVNKTATCWLWQGRRSKTGNYGQGKADGRLLYAHRIAYALEKGPIPPGLDLDHLCRVRSCVNPAHLEAVTHRENVRRGNTGAHNARKTHCPQGHPYAVETTRIHPRTGYRSCGLCHTASVLRSRIRRAQGLHIRTISAIACPRGHSKTPENTYTYPHGARVCKECRRIAYRQYYAKKFKANEA